MSVFCIKWEALLLGTMKKKLVLLFGKSVFLNNQCGERRIERTLFRRMSPARFVSQGLLRIKSCFPFEKNRFPIHVDPRCELPLVPKQLIRGRTIVNTRVKESLVNTWIFYAGKNEEEKGVMWRKSVSRGHKEVSVICFCEEENGSRGKKRRPNTRPNFCPHIHRLIIFLSSKHDVVLL